MSSVWDDDSFAQAWNDTYGLDMAKAPIRPGLIYPLIAESIGAATGLRLIDFGCGNGSSAISKTALSSTGWALMEGAPFSKPHLI